MFKFEHNCGERNAFTLAETLVTLGIIGVVAALTMPSLINKYQEQVFKNAYKKAYADVNAAFKFLIANEEYILPEKMDDDKNIFFSKDPYLFGKNLKNLAKYFKVVKTCYDNNAGECFSLNGECGRGTMDFGLGMDCPATSYAFMDASGRQWYMYANNEATFIVDTNGDKAPNKLGKDRFPLEFPIPDYKVLSYNSKMLINPTFKPNHNYADTVADENGDLINKQRWCPSGNCYYTSWLLN